MLLGTVDYLRRSSRTTTMILSVFLVVYTVQLETAIVGSDMHFFANAFSVTSASNRPRYGQRMLSTNIRPKHIRLVTSEDDSPSDASQPEKTGKIDYKSAIKWIPTRIEFEGVYRSYGTPSFFRKLTSSVPRREFALEDLTIAFGKGNLQSDNEDSLCLLLGASSSGKSTIFRSILDSGRDGTKGDPATMFGSAENRGYVRIRRVPSPGQTPVATAAKPIQLDDRREINSKNASGRPKAIIRDAWVDCVPNAASCEEGNQFATFLVEFLARNIFELDPEALLEELTPSERYRFCLGKACIQSSMTNTDSSSALPGPILLLDEWMDVETSAVVRKVQPSLHKIVEDLNGVVISITHKPELYFNGGRSSPLVGNGSNVRRITLSAGKLLSEL
mmetsp:Transcript_3845/g.10086  ORF Transcript_3845/g.10086 Transcript_3845/m.10086 type:complete len:390 (-) Transcript_3845:210-1379(-)